MGRGGLKGNISQREVGPLEYLVQNHLWIFAIWIVPISVLYDVFWYLRTRWVRWVVGPALPPGQKVEELSNKSRKETANFAALFSCLKVFFLDFLAHSNN